MLGSIFTGLSGLLTFSKGLDVISDNVANMNTPGYKSKSLQFQELYYQSHLESEHNGSFNTYQIGGGVQAGASSVIFTQGDIKDTGNDTDAAINGNGFFVLKDEGEIFYSRAGQFQLDDDGNLVSSQSGAKVMALKSGNQLSNINISGFRTSPPAATSEIIFSDNLSTGSQTHAITDIKVFDSSGVQHTLSIEFTNNTASTPRSWLIEVLDSNGDSIGSGEIRFQGNGSPEVDFNKIPVSYTPPNSELFAFDLNFGEPGSFTGATSFSGGSTSTLKESSTNGYGVGSITKVSFNVNGKMLIEYSNGENIKPFTLALAHFENQSGLDSVGKGLLTNTTSDKVTYDSAGNGVMGTLVGGSIELSNVELTQEFSNLVVTQRGYQASSQVLTVANEMIQQLIDATGGR